MEIICCESERDDSPYYLRVIRLKVKISKLYIYIYYFILVESFHPIQELR